MSKIFYYDDGRPSSLPTSKDEAKRLRQNRYNAEAVCPNCKESNSRYTINDECSFCAMLKALEFYNYAVGASYFADINGPNLIYRSTSEPTPFGEELKIKFEHAKALFYTDERAPVSTTEARDRGLTLWVRDRQCSKAGHFGIRTLKGECYFCVQKRITLSPRKLAIAKGDKWYTPIEPCKYCNQLADKRVADSKCSGCHPRIRNVSPRQAAIANGEKWYTPLESCAKCGQTALRNVANGQCKGCIQSEGDARETSDTIMMRECPDLVVSKKDAKAMELKVYRTGKECTNGHSGYRYVSTGSCIQCLRG